MTSRIYSPEGTIGTPVTSRAPSPDVLAGLRLVALDNGKPGADVLMERVRDLRRNLQVPPSTPLSWVTLNVALQKFDVGVQSGRRVRRVQRRRDVH